MTGAAGPRTRCDAASFSSVSLYSTLQLFSGALVVVILLLVLAIVLARVLADLAEVLNDC